HLRDADVADRRPGGVRAAVGGVSAGRAGRAGLPRQRRRVRGGWRGGGTPGTTEPKLGSGGFWRGAWTGTPTEGLSRSGGGGSFHRIRSWRIRSKYLPTDEVSPSFSRFPVPGFLSARTV